MSGPHDSSRAGFQEASMSVSGSNAMATRPVLIARLVGFCMYVAAFFLPACREADSLHGFKGYECAWITLVNTVSRELWRSVDCLAVLSGWINPLLLLYLIFLLIPSFRWPRRIVALAIVIFIAGTWVFFAHAHLVPLIGHLLWIAGILLILAGEAVEQGKAGPKAA
jgi:hypothetical protein